jgi:hypothetical protein
LGIGEEVKPDEQIRKQMVGLISFYSLKQLPHPKKLYDRLWHEFTKPFEIVEHCCSHFPRKPAPSHSSFQRNRERN